MGTLLTSRKWTRFVFGQTVPVLSKSPPRMVHILGCSCSLNSYGFRLLPLSLRFYSWADSFPRAFSFSQQRNRRKRKKNITRMIIDVINSHLLYLSHLSHISLFVSCPSPSLFCFGLVWFVRFFVFSTRFVV